MKKIFLLTFAMLVNLLFSNLFAVHTQDAISIVSANPPLSKNSISTFPGTEHFRTQRNLPFRDIGEIAKKLYVSDFEQEGKTKTYVIAEALSALKNTEGKAELIFDSPIYEIDFSGNESVVYNLNGLTDKVINGNQALIIIKNPTVGFIRLVNSVNCIIRDFEIDYSPLPFVQSVITSVDQAKGTFNCRVDDGFSNFEAKHVISAPQNWGMIKDPDYPGRNKAGVNAHYTSSEIIKLDGSTYRVSVGTNNIQDFNVGDIYIKLARYNGSVAIDLSNCNRVTIMGVTVYASPAGVFKSTSSSEVNILDCNVKLQTGRYASSNADCIHHRGAGVGPWIEGCLFEGHSDDAFNLKWKKALIKDQAASNMMTINSSCQVGELLWVYNPRDGVLLDTVRVTKVVRENNQTYHLTLTGNLPVLYTGRTDQRGDIVYFDSGRNESFVFRNNIVRNHRRYGILLQSGYGLVENNRFENSSNSAITIENGVDWGEGFIAEHLLIRNNVFVNNGYDRSYLEKQNACIHIQTSKLDNVNAPGTWCGVAPALWRGMKNIWIQNNIFEDWNKKAIHVVSADDVIIRNNSFAPKKDTSDIRVFVENAHVTEENSVSLATTEIEIADDDVKYILCYDFSGRLVFFIENQKADNMMGNLIKSKMQQLKGLYLLKTISFNNVTETRKVQVL